MTKTKETKIPLIAVQILSVVLGIIMVLNFTFLMMKKVTLINFWILTGIIGAIAVWGIPRLRKMAS